MANAAGALGFLMDKNIGCSWSQQRETLSPKNPNNTVKRKNNRPKLVILMGLEMPLCIG
jgi:hypothetical protein